MMTVDVCAQEVNQYLEDLLSPSVFATGFDLLIVSSEQTQKYVQNRYDLAIIIQGRIASCEVHAEHITYVDMTESNITLQEEILKELMMCIRAPYFKNNEHWYSSLLPHYQPIYDMQSESICGYEVLARILCGEELIQPDIALHWLAPVENSMIFKTLLNLARKQFSNDKQKHNLYFNIDCATLINPASFKMLKDEIMKHYEENTSLSLILELTEDELEKTHTSSHTLDSNMQSLKSVGAKFVIDDFGAKSSNFDRLRRFKPHIHAVKIDKRYFWQLHENSESEEDKTQTIVELIKSLRIDRVIFEGIESQEHIAKVISIIKSSSKDISVCAQGFHLGRPSSNPLILEAI